MSDTDARLQPFVSTGSLSEADPDADRIICLEQERQTSRLILIPSQSIAPKAVHQALASVFAHVDATGYPSLQMTRDELDEVLDYKWQLARHRRYSNRRRNRGTEYADMIETLAARRCAQCFATAQVPAEQLFVNIQPLSAAAANHAAFKTLLKPGDTIMGLARTHGGHLTHGRDFGYSGTRYRAVAYESASSTGQLDYDRIMEIALAERPRMIIAGYGSYPWAPDWGSFRQICDAVGDCVLLADISQPAGMVISGQYPSPIGHADVITMATHTTLCGPRAAAIMTTDQELAGRLDHAISTAQPDGPHLSSIAAMAVSFRIAQTDSFRALQHQIVRNSAHLAEALTQRGVPLAYGGTNTHLCVADLRGFTGQDGSALNAEVAARILDLCGITVGTSAIPDDRSSANANGIALGTLWLTQRGFTALHLDRLADIIADTLRSIQPYSPLFSARRGTQGKSTLDALERAKTDTASLISETMPATGPDRLTCPHSLLADTGVPAHDASEKLPTEITDALEQHPLFLCSDIGLLSVRGQRPAAFLQHLLTGDVTALQPGQAMHGFLLDEHGALMDDVLLVRPQDSSICRYLLVTHAPNHARVTAWLHGHSDGCLCLDEEDTSRQMQHPVVVDDLTAQSADPQNRVQPQACRLQLSEAQLQARRDAGLPDYADGQSRLSGLQLYQGGHAERFDLSKPYFVGQRQIERAVELASMPASFRWEEPEQPLRRTVLYDRHRELGGRMSPFAGWEMPLWYSSISDEHAAVRNTGALFDISHMGCIEVSGPHALSFLETVTTNHVHMLEIGQSHYCFLLDTEGIVLDDVIIGRRGSDRFMVVVNAANAEKVRAWLQAINSRQCVIDARFPHRQIEASATLTDLAAPAAGERQLAGLALQGPVSDRLLRTLRGDRSIGGPLAALRKFGFIEDRIGDIPSLISRTGYTGEDIGYELYVHPEHLVQLWDAVLEVGQEMGVVPAGLGSRDSTRIEVGLPLYGHELAGPRQIPPTVAGYSAFVRPDKPFFIGREAVIEHHQQCSRRIVRFQIDQPRAHAIRTDDPVASRRGQIVGVVTSCTLVGDRQIGMAYVDRQSASPGTPLLIYPSRQLDRMDKSSEQLELGTQLPLHEAATVLSRFPGRG
ncbi:MAG: glycine cleavage system aminomethyltransferase GcvT [candidate division WS1 bacterium]|nr:glycine cleavage system aminomethyltransferase GcvT [candidate division WS1 bacterium]